MRGVSRSVRESIERIGAEAYNELYGWQPEELPPEFVTAMARFLEDSGDDADRAARYAEAMRLARQVRVDRARKDDEDDPPARKKFLGIF